MTVTVSVQEATASLPRLLARVMNGEDILIAQDGVPVARLSPAGELALSDAGGDEEMGRLAAAAQSHSEGRFLGAIAMIDWTKRPARDYLRAARLALLAGAHQSARRTSQAGAARYPEDRELRKLADVLAPPRVVGRAPADPHWGASMDANRAWVKANAAKYASQYVALREGKLIAAAATMKALLEKTGDQRDDYTLITRVS